MITRSAFRTRTVRRIGKELTSVADYWRLCPVSIHQTVPREKLEHARKSPFRVVRAAIGWAQSLGEAEKQSQRYCRTCRCECPLAFLEQDLDPSFPPC